MCEAAATSTSTSNANASNNGEADSNGQQNRPKLYKIREELNQYYALVNEHLVSSYIYDIYLELKPNTFRQIHAFALGVGKLARLIFLYFLFYHTIWYFPLSKERRNSPLNTTHLDTVLAIIVLYMNFYHIIVHKFLAKCLLDELIRTTVRSLSANKARVVVYLIEMLIYAVIDVYLFYVLRVYCGLKLPACLAILLPHVAFKINRYFHLNVTLFGWCIYKNKYTRESLFGGSENGMSAAATATTIEKADGSTTGNNLTTGVSTAAAANNSNTSGKYVYSDCSNLTVANYLSKSKVCMPSLYLSTNAFGSSKATVEDPFKVKHTMLSHHYRSLKSSQTKAKLYSVLMSSVLNKPIRLVMSLMSRLLNVLVRVGDLFKTCTCSYKTPSQRYYTNAMHLNQSNSGSCYWANTILLSDQVQHRCEREATSVRDEAETFMCDFYSRLNRVVSCTLETVYYSFLIVRLHVPAALHVKDFHFIIYTSAMFFSLFATYFVYHIPFSVMITNKRCAQHLGIWALDDELNKSNNKTSLTTKRSTKPNDLVPPQSATINRWQPSKIYFMGDRVLYGGKVYRVVSHYCASIPNVRFYSSYYRLFKEPTLFYTCLIVFKLIGISLMVGYLIYNRLWYSVIMNIIELGTNFISYYVILRDLIYLTGISRPKPSSSSSSSSSEESNNTNLTNTNLKKAQ